MNLLLQNTLDKSRKALKKTKALYEKLTTEIVKTGLPKEMKITFSENSLEINGVSTNISSKSVEHLLLGMTEFLGEEEAIKEAASLIRKKLKKLY
jgi:hypothetical protein